LVVGMSGSGKTTLAQTLAQRFDLPFHEMDELAFGPGWRARPEMLANVARIVARPRWIFDSWGYESVRRMMWLHADTVVWLDYPRGLVMRRVLHRSVARTVTRQRIFGGNRETVTGWFSQEHPAWHALAHIEQRRSDIEALVNSHSNLPVVRLINHHAAQRWLASLPVAPEGDRRAPVVE
jgi:adenylate kinase family enzyme